MDSYLLGKNPILIHNYMKGVLLEDDLKTTPMNSCDYIVMGEENHDIAVCKNGYCLGGKKSNSEVKITIGRVFQLNSSDDEAFSLAHPDWRDVCLSFALAKILRRRFVNLPLDESGSPKALDFVLKGLIDYIGRNEDIPPEKRIGERNPERVFGVIQDELNFILEFSHTKVPTRNYFSWRLPVDLVGCIIMAGILMYIYHTGLNFKDIDHQLKSYASSDLHEQDYAYCDCIIDICGTWIYIFDQFITGILALSCLYILLLWIQAVSGSKHWSTLRLVKQYIENPAKWNSRSSVAASISSNFVRFENMISSFLSPNVKNFEPARIHYSIFDIKFRGRILGNFLRWIRKKIPRPFLPTVSHSADVKEAILWSLRKSGGQLTDGKTALKSHGMLDHLYQVCQHSENTTETIFIWHIATTLFHYQKPPPQQNDDLFKKERTVALDLSTYCLYLLVCLPELLPEEVEWIEEMCGSMREEIYAIDLSSGRKPTAKNCCNHVIGAGVSDDKSMVGKGAMLAKQLVDYADNGTQVWTMLSEFWAEMMLFIAPSDNVEGHGEVLKEGELITQLWALLTHAGILTRSKASQSWNREY